MGQVRDHGERGGADIYPNAGTESVLADAAFHADTVERIAALHRIGEPMEVAGRWYFWRHRLRR